MDAICDCADVPVGEARSFKRVDTGLPAVLVVHLAGGRFLAYEDRCSHFGVPLGVTRDYRYLDGGDIVCQVHYARYAAEDGRCLRGECDGQGLRPVAVTVIGGKVYVA